jgi:hypothetical protein
MNIIFLKKYTDTLCGPKKNQLKKNPTQSVMKTNLGTGNTNKNNFTL